MRKICEHEIMTIGTVLVTCGAFGMAFAALQFIFFCHFISWLLHYLITTTNRNMS